MYAVTCANSRTGSLVVRHLLEAGRKVRAVVRDPEKAAGLREAGAEVAFADYREPEKLAKAIQGAEAVYVIPPPLPVTATGHHQYRVQATRGIARAFELAKTTYAVVLSSFAAQHKEGTGMIKSCHTCEEVLLEVKGTSLAMLRPAFFLENWTAQIPAARDGVLPSFLGPADRKFTMIGTADIAAAAARYLLEPAQGHRIVELSGPEDYSVNYIAAAFGRLLGREVKPAIYPVAQMSGFLQGSGFSKETADEYQELVAAMMTGHVALSGAVPLQRGVFGLAYVLGSMLRRAGITSAA